MRHLLAFKPIVVHISFDVAKLSAVVGETWEFVVILGRFALHPGPLGGSGWAAAVAAIQLAPHFLDVEVDANRAVAMRHG
jgi:hypothetical protein